LLHNLVVSIFQWQVVRVFASSLLPHICLFKSVNAGLMGCALSSHIGAAETSDLSALQARLSQGQRVTAAAHRQLCQLAADRLQGSTARQYCLPLARVSDPAAAVAAYQIGRQIGQQLQEVQEQLQPADEQAQQDRQHQCLQLLLELESCSTQLVGDRLQLVVQLKPRLQLQHPQLQQARQQQQHEHKHHQQQAAGRHQTVEGGGNSSSSSWWGPLFQPCHAECVLWHADVSPVTSQSSWQWDAVTGLLTVQALLPLSLLVQLASGSRANSSSSMSTGLGGLSSIRQQAMPTAGSAAATATAAAAAGSADAYVGAAAAMAAAAATAAGISNSSSSSICGASMTDAPEVQLHAAVVVAACCSPQAVAQVKNKQLNSSSASAAALVGAAATAAHVVDYAELLAPATALLHLPALQVPVQQLLLQQLAGASAAWPALQQQQQQHNTGSALPPAAAGAGAASLGAAHLDSMHTPSRPLASKHNQQQQQQFGTLTAGPTSLQPSTAGGTNGHLSSYGGADVVPPTPYSAMQEDGMQQHEEHDNHEDIVIKDSQDSGGHVPDSVMRDAAPPAPASAAEPGSTAFAERTKQRPQQQQQQQQLPDRMFQAKHMRQLLLKCDPADSNSSNGTLLLLPSVLVQQLGFVAVAGPQAAELAVAVQQLDNQTQQQPVHVLLHLNTSRGVLQSHHAANVRSSSSGCSIRLAWFSSKAVHVELRGSCSQDVHALHKLLLMAVHSLSGVSLQGF
jgi:hypothetical protein